MGKAMLIISRAGIWASQKQRGLCSSISAAWGALSTPRSHRHSHGATSTALGRRLCVHQHQLQPGAAALVPVLAGVSPETEGSDRGSRHRLHSGTWPDPAQPLAAQGSGSLAVLHAHNTPTVLLEESDYPAQHYLSHPKQNLPFFLF